jgi:hypothetical protein
LSASLLRMANEGMSEDEAQALASVVRRQTGHDVEVLRLPLIRLAVIRHARALVQDFQHRPVPLLGHTQPVLRSPASPATPDNIAGASHERAHCPTALEPGTIPVAAA